MEIILISIALICVIILLNANSKNQRRIKQLEHDLKNLEEHTDEFRKKYNDGKKMPPKIPSIFDF